MSSSISRFRYIKGLARLLRGMRRIARRGDVLGNIEGAFDIADAVLDVGLGDLPVEYLRTDPAAAQLMRARYGADFVYSAAELSRAPGGSLGALLHRSMQEGYDPDFYRRLPHREVRSDVDWTSHRGRQIHDILHLVTGYPPTIVGEIGLFAFLAGNLRDYASFLIGAMALLGHLLLHPTKLERDVTVFARAWLCGRSVRPVLGVKFEDLFSDSIFDARESLGLPRYGLGAFDLNARQLQGYAFRELEPSALHAGEGSCAQSVAA